MIKKKYIKATLILMAFVITFLIVSKPNTFRIFVLVKGIGLEKNPFKSNQNEVIPTNINIELKKSVYGAEESTSPLQSSNAFTKKMEKRQTNVRKICSKFHRLDNASFSNWTYWPPTLEYSSANSSLHDQQLTPRHILLEPKSRTAYCFIHKVASSTWMSFFTHLHKDEKRFKALIHFGKYYRIPDYLGAADLLELVDKIWTGKYYSFMIVRHPFERALSAYRDRILRKDSSQAIRHIPRIFSMLKDSRAKFDTSRLFDRETEELIAIPSFEEFLRYITSASSDAASQDPHWQTYNKQCFPCLVPYDAIIKLDETEEESQLLTHSGLNNFITMEELSQWVHHTTGRSSVEVKHDFYKEIPCPLIQRLTEHFQMDLEMFEYDNKEYLKICKQ